MNIFNFTEATASQQQQWDESVDAFIQKMNDFFSGMAKIDKKERYPYLYEGLNKGGTYCDRVHLIPNQLGLTAHISLCRNGTVFVERFGMKKENSHEALRDVSLPKELKKIIDTYSKPRTGTSFLKEICPAIKKVYAAY